MEVLGGGDRWKCRVVAVHARTSRAQVPLREVLVVCMLVRQSQAREEAGLLAHHVQALLRRERLTQTRRHHLQGFTRGLGARFRVRVRFRQSERRCTLM